MDDRRRILKIYPLELVLKLDFLRNAALSYSLRYEFKFTENEKGMNPVFGVPTL